MKPDDGKVKRLIRRMNEVERSEGRLRKYLDGLAYEKPSVRKKKKSSLARWRRKVRPRDQEVRTFDGCIWKGGKLLEPRQKSVDDRVRRTNDRGPGLPPGPR